MDFCTPHPSALSGCHLSLKGKAINYIYSIILLNTIFCKHNLCVHKLRLYSLQIIHLKMVFCGIIRKIEKNSDLRRIYSWLYLF